MPGRNGRALCGAALICAIAAPSFAADKSCLAQVTTPGEALKNQRSNSLSDIKSLELSVVFHDTAESGQREADFLFERDGTLFTLQCIDANNPVCIVGRFFPNGDTNLNDVIMFTGVGGRPLNITVAWNFDGDISISRVGGEARTFKASVGPSRLKVESTTCDVEYRAAPAASSGP